MRGERLHELDLEEFVCVVAVGLVGGVGEGGDYVWVVAFAESGLLGRG